MIFNFSGIDNFLDLIDLLADTVTVFGLLAFCKIFLLSALFTLISSIPNKLTVFIH